MTLRYAGTFGRQFWSSCFDISVAKGLFLKNATNLPNHAKNHATKKTLKRSHIFGQRRHNFDQLKIFSIAFFSQKLGIAMIRAKGATIWAEDATNQTFSIKSSKDATFLNFGGFTPLQILWRHKGVQRRHFGVITPLLATLTSTLHNDRFWKDRLLSQAQFWSRNCICKTLIAWIIYVF